MKTSVFLFFFLITIPLFSQTYWERDFYGAPVQKQVVLSYKLDSYGEKDHLADSVVYTYFSMVS